VGRVSNPLRSLRMGSALPWALLAMALIAFAFQAGQHSHTSTDLAANSVTARRPEVDISLLPLQLSATNKPVAPVPIDASRAPVDYPETTTAHTIAYHQADPLGEDPLAGDPLQAGVLPPPATTEELPIGDPTMTDRVQISMHDDLLTLTARDAPLSSVLSLIAKQHGLNIISGDEITQRISVTLTNVRLDDALDTLLAVNGFTWSTQRNILIVSPLMGTRKAGPMVQGRIVRVFPLNYVSAVDVDRVVKGLLSPAGQSFIVEATPTDQRRTHEQVVVEDLPYYVARIEEYIRSSDYQPRQVLVEAHVLQVQLKDDCKHGVNFDQILRIANADVSLQAAGFANPAALPAGFLRINGTDLTAVVEALKTTTDAKTLASPKVAVLNGQEARFQVGGQIGYLTTTTTETAAVQSVNFLETGVILHVTPIITDDRQVLMNVRPEVSTGRINPTTNLPESETTVVETRVMLADGEAVVIGGLIKEIDNEVQNKIPWLGDVKYVGRLFQRRTITRERSEVIIALLPRIISEVPGNRQANPAEVCEATTPLFTGPLNRVDRSEWEPRLPDATCNPRHYPAPPAVEYGPPNQGSAPIHGPVPAHMPSGLDPLYLEPIAKPPASTGLQAPRVVQPASYAPTQGSPIKSATTMEANRTSELPVRLPQIDHPTP
jgi:type IV pilus assembly protein PilQ